MKPQGAACCCRFHCHCHYHRRFHCRCCRCYRYQACSRLRFQGSSDRSGTQEVLPPGSLCRRSCSMLYTRDRRFLSCEAYVQAWESKRVRVDVRHTWRILSSRRAAVFTIAIRTRHGWHRRARV